METNKLKKEDVVKEFFEKVDEPIVLKETESNSMTTTKSNFFVLWRPNNYRRQIAVKEKDDSAIQLIYNVIKSAISAIPPNVIPMSLNFNNHTKIISIKGYTPNITIQYGKNTLTGIYSQNKIGSVKEVFLIETLRWQDAQERIDQKKQEVENRIDTALYKFINQFNIGIPLKTPIWSRYEDFIKGEEYIDKIPREVIIHDTYFKVVYDEGLEFKSSKKEEEPTIHMKNYLKNRAIEDIAPQIEKELKDNKDELTLIKEMVKEGIKLNLSTSKTLAYSADHQAFMAENLRVHIPSLERLSKSSVGLDKGVKKLISILSQTKIGDYNG